MRYDVFKTSWGYSIDDPYDGTIAIELKYNSDCVHFTKEDLEKMIALFEEDEQKKKDPCFRCKKEQPQKDWLLCSKCIKELNSAWVHYTSKNK